MLKTQAQITGSPIYKGKILLLTTLAIFVAPFFLHADESATASQIIGKVQAHYNATTDFKASFVQTTAHKLFSNRLERSYGEVYLRKNGMMHWAYSRPEPKYFIYDGQTLWVYEPEVPQVFKGQADSERLKKALAFMTGSVRIEDEYNVRKLNEKKFKFTEGYVLGLLPKEKGSPFKMIELYVAAGDFHVVRSVVVDHEGNRNRFDFVDPAYNNSLDDGLFAFAPPAGVPVIEKQ